MQTSQDEDKNWLEWSVFAVGCVLVAGVVVNLGYQIWRSQPRSTPQLHVIAGRPEVQAGNFAIPITVYNAGQTTAEDVHIQVVLQKQGQPVESSLLRMQFVPQGARRHGYAIFVTDPATVSRISAHPLGYQHP